MISRKDKDVFETLTERYDSWYDSKDKGRYLYESELRCLKSLVDLQEDHILEIGVGTGRFAMHFPNAVGADPSLNALGMAKSRGIKTVQARGEILPFKNETFGYVLTIITLSFVDNPLDVLREARRVLKREGHIIIGFVEKNSTWGFLYSEKKRDGRPFYSDARFFSFSEIEGLLQESDLKITTVKSTLLQRPEETRRVELPVEGYEKMAGFICVKAEKIIRDQRE